MNNLNFDEDWLFNLMDKAHPLSKNPNGFELMMNQMLSPNPQYGVVQDVEQKDVVNIYHFKRGDFFHKITLLWRVCKLLNALGSIPSAQRFLKDFALNYAKFLITENPDKFNFSLPSSATSLFSKITRFEGMDYVKKIIQGLYFHSNAKIEVTEDMKEFLYDF